MSFPLSGGPPRVVVDTPGQDYEGRLSPDGRWMIYVVSDNAGRSLFLAPFPASGGKWQVSNEPVYSAWWNPNGREILYISSDHVVSVDVAIEGGSVRLGAPKPLFAVSVNTNNYSVSMTPDGQRFLVVTTRPPGSVAATLVTNWDAALK